ncbi:hypothetical protein KCU73_g3801, partial [Aureobasidium melanogenum]
LKELPALPSYAKLKFKQPLQPTNRSNVLWEGYSHAETTAELAARAAATLIVRREQRHAYREAVERRLYVCANCQTEESYSWHKLKDVEEDQGDIVCRRCESYWISYGCYPDPEKLRRPAQKSEQIASYVNDPPPPGYCQNDNCQQDVNSK